MLRFELAFARTLVSIACLERVFDTLVNAGCDDLEILDEDGRLLGSPRASRDFASTILATSESATPLYTSLVEASGEPPFSRRTGGAQIRSRSGNARMSISLDEWATSPRSDGIALNNALAGEIAGPPQDPSGRMAQELFRHAAEELVPTWGRCCCPGEYEVKNLDRLAGVRALGRDFSKWLPGLYWLNLFGPEYVDLIGHEQLEQLSPGHAERQGDCYLVRLSDAPDSWPSSDYKATEEKALDALGRTVFFRRDDPPASSRSVRWPRPWEIPVDGGN